MMKNNSNQKPVDHGTMTMKFAKNVTVEQSCAIPQNANTLVVGSSGAGKTRSLFSPNILEAEGSYLISDPKGALYKRYSGYLKERGYQVGIVDFTHPGLASHRGGYLRYNPFAFVRTELDILKVTRILVGEIESRIEPFWEHQATLLLTGLVGYLKESRTPDRQSLKDLLDLVFLCIPNERGRCEMDDFMENLSKRNPDSFAFRQFTKVRMAPVRTYMSILSTIEAKLGIFECDGLTDMLSENEVSFRDLGTKKAAIFVVVSDTDRSMDRLANIFFTQAMDELIRYADDDCPGQMLPVPVRFFLDDFATNVAIDNFPRMISSIRSRNISTMLAIQAESQLEAVYGADKETIIANCDTYVYCGGNDMATASSVAKRCNKGVDRILNMSPGKAWILRRGEKPLYTDLLKIEECEKEQGFRQRKAIKTEREQTVESPIIVTWENEMPFS